MFVRTDLYPVSQRTKIAEREKTQSKIKSWMGQLEWPVTIPSSVWNKRNKNLWMRLNLKCHTNHLSTLPPFILVRMTDRTSFKTRFRSILGATFEDLWICWIKERNLAYNTVIRCFLLEITSIRFLCVCNGSPNIFLTTTL